MAGNGNGGRPKGVKNKISLSRVRALLSAGDQDKFWERCLALGMGTYVHEKDAKPLLPNAKYANIVADRLEAKLASLPYYEEEANALLETIEKLKAVIEELRNAKSTNS